ncbi:MAG: alkaline phosphatase family protein, partial [Candidatus Baltobacteraceae bacterium]
MPMPSNAVRAFALASLAFSISGCGGGSGPTPNAGLLPAKAARHSATLLRGPQSSGKIQHVVIIVQENRSFDNLFQGYPGADTRSYGYNSKNQKITLTPVGLETYWDIDHSSGSFYAACNGTGKVPGTKCRMNGFDRESEGCQSSCPPNPQYGYVPQNESKPYFNMAAQYVLADRMFASNFDASSFVSHQYIIGAQASSAVDYPNGGSWGCDGGPNDKVTTVTRHPERQYGPQIQACFDNTTLGDEVDTAHGTWRYYTASLNGDGNIWSAYQAIRHIRYGPDWTADISTPQTNFFNDIQGGFLANVTWITPTCENSDHAGCGSNTGPQWVTSLVNAIGNSQFWDSTAIFIMWDDYGGWYDHVAPTLLDYDGAGLRVPLLIISPYAKKGYVSHVHYEHGSILKFAEDQFGLPR